MSELIFRVVDVETTSDQADAEVIELGYQDVVWEGDELSLGGFGSFLFNYDGEMSIGALAVHHIPKEDVKGLPIFGGGMGLLYYRDQRGWIPPERPAAYLVAHNAKFERSVLNAQAALVLADPHGTAGFSGPHWLCTFKGARRLWPDLEKHTNSYLRYALDLDVNRARAMPPHRALPDAYVTAHILCRQLELAPLADLAMWSDQPAYLERCPIGSCRGKLWPEVDYGLLKWIRQKKGELGEDVVHAAAEEERRRFSSGHQRRGA